MKRQNVRTLSLIVVTFTYLLLGAAIFDALESDQEVADEHDLRKREMELRHKFNLSQSDIDIIKQLGIQMKSYKAGTQWKFAGAFYFATTVITTIGYGHSTPKTAGGKIFCMCYAIPGIPLTLIMFQSIGERMNTIITWILRQLKHHMGCRRRYVSQTHLMIVSFTTGSTVLTIGAAVFSRCEQWTYLDAFYYCFITLTTIGFGDYVALQRDDYMAKRPDYVAFSLIFILFGLTVVSSVMNLLVLRFLTMNTEDERRDQLVAAAQARELNRLHGDVIWMESSGKKVSGQNHINLNNTSKVSSPTQPASLPIVSEPSGSSNFSNFHSFCNGLFSWFVSGTRRTDTHYPISKNVYRSLPRESNHAYNKPHCRMDFPHTARNPAPQNYYNSCSSSIVGMFHSLGHSVQQLMQAPSRKEEVEFVSSREPILNDNAYLHMRRSHTPRLCGSTECLPIHPNTFTSHSSISSKLLNITHHMKCGHLGLQGYHYSMSSLYSYTTLQEDGDRDFCNISSNYLCHSRFRRQSFPSICQTYFDTEQHGKLPSRLLPEQPVCDQYKKSFRFSGCVLHPKLGRNNLSKAHGAAKRWVRPSRFLYTNQYVSLSAENSQQSLELLSGSYEDCPIIGRLRVRYKSSSV